MTSYSSYQSYRTAPASVDNGHFGIDRVFANWSLPVDAKTKRHVSRVYSLLAATFISAAMGAWLHLVWHVGGLLTHVLSLALVAAIMATKGSEIGQPITRYVSNRSLMLVAYGLVQGASVGPLVEYAMYVDPIIVMTALALTANVFVCLTLSALYLPRRSTFALGSMLATGLTGLFWLSILSMVFPSVLFMKVQLYGGLLVFAGYLVFDSQMMIERAEHGSLSHDSHIDDALKLFTDLMAIFVRILVILIKNAVQKEGQEHNKKRSATARR